MRNAKRFQVRSNPCRIIKCESGMQLQTVCRMKIARHKTLSQGLLFWDGEMAKDSLGF
jgi:hypothetical protein